VNRTIVIHILISSELSSLSGSDEEMAIMIIKTKKGKILIDAPGRSSTVKELLSSPDGLA
jgi:hypothetical protein